MAAFCPTVQWAGYRKYAILGIDWFPRPELTSKLTGPGFGQPLPTMHHPHDIVFIKVKLQLLEIQMSIYPGKGGLTCLLSNLVKKVGVRGRISW